MNDDGWLLQIKKKTKKLKMCFTIFLVQLFFLNTY